MSSLDAQRAQQPEARGAEESRALAAEDEVASLGERLRDTPSAARGRAGVRGGKHLGWRRGAGGACRRADPRETSTQEPHRSVGISHRVGREDRARNIGSRGRGGIGDHPLGPVSLELLGARAVRVRRVRPRVRKGPRLNSSHW